jgi:hypothetical protein
MLDRTNDSNLVQRVGTVISPPAAARIELAGRKPGRRRANRELRNASNREYRRRYDAGKVILKISAFTLRAETFARRFCGLTGDDPSNADIEQSVVNFINIRRSRYYGGPVAEKDRGGLNPSRGPASLS